jgi:multicomponent Na+:H+ antiporter subunit C
VETLLAFVIGGLYAAGLYLVMRRSLLRLVFGLALLSHAAHLLIFTVSGPTRGGAPIAAPGAQAPAAPFADPLPQALILTAIVIGFGVQAFLLVLIRRAWEATKTDDLDALRSTDS